MILSLISIKQQIAIHRIEIILGSSQMPFWLSQSAKVMNSSAAII